MFDWLKKLLEMDSQDAASAAHGSQSGQDSPVQAPPSAREMLKSKASTASPPNLVDYAQAVGDLLGTIDPTGIVDATNSTVSLTRALVSSSGEDRQRHLSDAAIRAAGTIPFVGDFAKVGRTARYMEEIESARKTLQFLNVATPSAGNRVAKTMKLVSGSLRNLLERPYAQGASDMVTLYRGVRKEALSKEFLPPLSESEQREHEKIIRTTQERELSRQEKKQLRDLESRRGSSEKFYTDDIRHAQGYAKEDGSVFQIQVPRKQLRDYVDTKSSLSSGTSGTNYRIPFSIHAAGAKKQEVENPKKGTFSTKVENVLKTWMGTNTRARNVRRSSSAPDVRKSDLLYPYQEAARAEVDAEDKDSESVHQNYIQELKDKWGIDESHPQFQDMLSQLGDVKSTQPSRRSEPPTQSSTQRTPGLFSSLLKRFESPRPASAKDYFFASKEDRRRMRMDDQSPFHDPQEAQDERYRSVGAETDEGRQRRRRREKSEDLHQEFLRNPNKDYSEQPAHIRRAKSDFDTQSRQVTQEEQDQRDDKAKGALGDVGKALFAPVTGIAEGFSGLLKGDLAGALKGFAKSITATATVLITLPPALKKFGESLTESIRTTAMYDGRTSFRMAGLDVQKIHLDMQYGKNTGGSASAFLDEMKALRQEFQPIRGAGGILLNNIGTAVIRASRAIVYMETSIIKAAEQIPGLAQIAEWLKNEKAKEKQDDATRGQKFGQFLMNDGPLNPFEKGKREPLKPLKPMK